MAALLVVAVAGCGLGVLGGPGGGEVLPPADGTAAVDLPVPTYAVATRRGLLLRSGDAERLVDQGRDARFLPDGRALVGIGFRLGRWRVVDVEDGGGPLARTGYADPPGRTATTWTFLDRYREPARLFRYRADLSGRDVVELPGTDDPATTEAGAIRDYFGVAPTVDGATFVQWHDGGTSETYDGDRGLTRVAEDGTAEVVQREERVVALYLATDGSGLLALRQSRGEPCGGCQVDQEVVEVDPETGGLVELGRPDGYDDSWRVAAMDKVGDRVAVRYERAGDGRSPHRRLLGTWVLEDGDWSLLPGSDEVVTWWQTGGRVLARPAYDEAPGRDGWSLSWVADGEDAETPVEGELTGRDGRRYLTGQVPGQLLPPKRED